MLSFRPRDLVASSACVAALLLGAAPARAHPHVFIDNRVRAVFSSGRLTAFALEWRFDELATQGVLFGRKPAGAPLQPAEIPGLRKKAFDNLVHYGYFVHVWQGGKADPVGGIEAFDAHLDGSRIVYDFTARLARPLDPKRMPVQADFYDETYFVDVEFPEGDPRPVTMTGSPAGCTATAGEDAAHPIPLWGFSPSGVTIACA